MQQADHDQKTLLCAIAEKEQRKSYRHKIRTIRMEAERLNQESARLRIKSANSSYVTNETVKKEYDRQNNRNNIEQIIRYEDHDINEKYK